MPGRPYKWRKEDLEGSPSRRDGFSKKQEMLWRRRYCILIDRAVKSIGLSHQAEETAIAYCHRYYVHRSMARNDPLVIACAALYLAAKVEEQPKQVSIICDAIFGIAHRHKSKVLEIHRTREFCLKLKEKVLTAERALLYTLGFDLEVEHPSLTAYEYCNTHWDKLVPANLAKDERIKLAEDLTNVAWHVCLCGCHSLLCLQQEAKSVAIAAIFVALQLLKLEPSPKNGWLWWENDISLETLHECVDQLLDVYDRRPSEPADGPQIPAFRLQRQGRPAHHALAAAQYAPGSDPRSDQSEQTQLLPGTKPLAPTSMDGDFAIAAIQ